MITSCLELASTQLSDSDCPSSVVEAVAQELCSSSSDREQIGGVVTSAAAAGIARQVQSASNSGDWSWSGVDSISANVGVDGTGDMGWVSDSEMLRVAIYARLRGTWQSTNRKQLRQKVAAFQNSNIIQFHAARPPAPTPTTDWLEYHVTGQLPPDPHTTYLLSWPDRLRTTGESQRLLLAILAGHRDNMFLNLATYAAHPGRYSRALLSAWPLIVEWWRRSHPYGVQRRPYIHHTSVPTSDVSSVHHLWPFRRTLVREYEHLFQWLRYRARHPTTRPFRLPHWVHPNVVTVANSVSGLSAREQSPSGSNDVDAIQETLARMLSVFLCLTILRRPPTQTDYRIVYRAAAKFMHVEFDRKAWSNFLMHRL